MGAWNRCWHENAGAETNRIIERRRRKLSKPDHNERSKENVMSFYLRINESPRLVFSLLVGIALICAATADARAASITIGFTGSISSVTGGLSGVFNTSQTLLGTYTFDSLSPDLDPTPTVG